VIVNVRVAGEKAPTSCAFAVASPAGAANLRVGSSKLLSRRPQHKRFGYAVLGNRFEWS
jgi:hypothetical protein